jgi:hypothetical protein
MNATGRGSCMPRDFTQEVLDALQVTGEEYQARLESRSGAGARAVRTADGHSAYLKVTTATQGTEAIKAARRELCFYQTLAPVTPLYTPGLLGSLDTESGVAVLLRRWADLVRPARGPVECGRTWAGNWPDCTTCRCPGHRLLEPAGRVA